MTTAAEGPHGLNVVLTAACNLRCAYCFQNAKNRRRATWDTVRAAIDLLLGFRGRELRLGFYGGEPLLAFPMLRRAVAYAISHRPRRKHLVFSVVTNGTLLDADTAEFLVRHGFSTWLSFDGVPAAQERRGPGTFAVLDALLDRLSAEHPTWFRENLRVGVVLTAATIPHLAESVAYFASKGVRTIDLAPTITHDAEWTDACCLELRRQLERAFRSALRDFRRSGEIPISAFRRGRAAQGPPRRAGAMCGVGRPAALTVDVDGQVYPCTVLARSGQRSTSKLLEQRLGPLCLGRVTSERLRDRLARLPEIVLAAEIFDDKEAKHSSHGRCGECPHVELCSVCPVSIGHIPGNADPRRIPDSICAFNLLVGEYRRRFPREPDTIDFLTGADRLPGLMQAVGRFLGPAEPPPSPGPDTATRG